MPQTVRILDLGDLHAGHELGLWPEEGILLPDGTERPLNKGQAHLLECWKHLARLAREEIKPDILIVHGDLVDGEGRKSFGTEHLTTIISAQIKAAKLLLQPFVDLVKEVYILRGCVAPGQRVLTADLRWVRVETLRAGDILLAFDEEWNWTSSIVTRAVPDLAPLVEITLEDGRTLVCTEDHPWVVGHGSAYAWAKAGNLKARRSRVREFLPVWEEDTSWGAGWLSGFYDGEGSFSQKQYEDSRGAQARLQFAQKSGAILDKAVALHEERGFVLTGQRSTSERRGAEHLHLNGGRPEVMRLLGSIRPTRLLEKFRPDLLGKLKQRRSVRVMSIRRIGMGQIISLSTTSGTYMVEGFGSHNTPYHDGARGLIVEAIGEGMGAVGPTPGWHSWDLLDLDVGGAIVNVQHSISVSSGLYRATPLDREGIWSALAGKEGKVPKADVVVRGHAHIYVHVEHPTKHILISPCWQLQTEYMRRHSAYRMLPDIGAVVLDIDPSQKAKGEDPVQVRKVLYPLPERVPHSSAVNKEEKPV